MKIEFQGIKKTKRCILDNLMKASENLETLKNKLQNLKIFSSVESNFNKVKVVEDKSRINLSSNSISGKTKNTLNIILPNVFGRAINSRLSLSSLKDYKIEISKPIFTKKLFFLNFYNTSQLIKLPCGSYQVNKSEIETDLSPVKVAVGLDMLSTQFNKYVRIGYDDSLMKIDIKQGISQKPYTKVEANKKISINLFFDWLKYDSCLGIGSIFGKPPQYEKFYLGKNIKGYKDKVLSPTDCNLKNGGLSYIELTNKIVFAPSKFNFYLFNSLGFNSRQSNLVNTTKEVYKEIKNMNNSAFGLSVGVGAALPLDNNNVLNATLSFPLTNNPNIEKYQFDLNLDF